MTSGSSRLNAPICYFGAFDPAEPTNPTDNTRLAAAPPELEWLKSADLGLNRN
jgi:hypothetical protein